jgi:dihydroorotase
MMTRYRAPRLLQPGHPLHGQPVDVAVEDGRIVSIGAASSGSKGADDHLLSNCWISSGWWDGQVDFRDPGTERAEGLSQGLKAAAQGGFTRVAPVASTRPCRDQPAEVLALLHRTSNAICGVLPVAALSTGCQGDQLTEAYALKNAGARAFSDDAPIARPELLRRALEYHQTTGLSVFSEAIDPDFQPDGVMHEGAMSTALGLPGNSSESELLRIARELDILSYAGGRLHFPVVTTAAGLEAILAAKKKGLQVTCGTTVHHLCWTDEDLNGFNSAMKLSPPLRSKDDRFALREAVLNGVVDLVVSDHRPRTPEEHDVDFIVVKPGVAGIHAVGPALLGALTDHGATIDEALTALHGVLVTGPRKVYAASEAEMGRVEGQPAEFTVFSTNETSIPKSASRAPNTLCTPDTAHMLGQVVGVVTTRGSHWN